MNETVGVKEQLILAALAEINETGVMELSLRKVAERCGVSCAAPYRHFESKDELLKAVFHYMCEQWKTTKQRILAENQDSMRNAIVEMCMAYIRFLTDNPEYLRVIMKCRKKFSWVDSPDGVEPVAFDRILFEQYADSVHLDPIARIRRLHSMQSFIYGAAIMFIDGEAPYTVEYLGLTKFDIECMLMSVD